MEVGAVVAEQEGDGRGELRRGGGCGDGGLHQRVETFGRELRSPVGHDVGDGGAGGHGVEAQTLGSVHHGRVLGQADDGVLGRGVGGAGGGTAQAGLGGNVDHGTGSGFEHQRHHGAGESHEGRDVDPEDAVPEVVVHFVDGGEVVHDAGDVRQGVHPSAGGSDDGGHGLLIGDVAGHGNQVQSGVLGHKVVQAFLADVGRDDLAALLGDAQGGGRWIGMQGAGRLVNTIHNCGF